MRSLLIILSSPSRQDWAQQLVTAAHAQQQLTLVATPHEAALHIARAKISPTHVVLDIGGRGMNILPEIDELAHQCEPGTRVIAIGDTNDVLLYREMIGRGVLDYLPHPAPIESVLKVLTSSTQAAAKTKSSNKRVIVFMSAASGDGASTIALNTAYAISQMAEGSTVLVDMDYQFGMVAKNLALQNQYGIGDLFDHPERGVDAVLIKRMVASYRKLHVITAPSELRYLPVVNANAIRELISTLSESYDNVIIDLPHVWLPWVSVAAQQATHLVLVSQLWLKSVSHAARMMRALREISVPPERVTAIINRSGAKFKEAIEPKDFERVCNIPIRYTVSNDIKTIVEAEGSASTVMELNPSPISADIERIVRGLFDINRRNVAEDKRGGLFSKFKG